MPSAHDLSRELNGLGDSSSRGTKRTADDLNRSHILNGVTEPLWRKPPTEIRTTASLQARKGGNPYAGIGSRKIRNPSAGQTITDMHQLKRKKTSSNGFNGMSEPKSSRYFAKDSRKSTPSSVISQAVPSTVRAGPSRERETLGLPLSKPDINIPRNNGAASSTNLRKPPTEIIDIDESEPEDDLGVRISRIQPASSTGDDLDLFNQPPSPSSPREIKTRLKAPTLAKKLGMSEPDKQHPFRTNSPPPSKPFSPYRSHVIAGDGESTKRLRAQYSYKGPGSFLQNRQGSPLASPVPEERSTPRSIIAPTPPRVERVEEVEEIDDADGFSDPSRTSLSRTPSTARQTSRSFKRKLALTEEVTAKDKYIEVIDEADTFSDLPQASSSKPPSAKYSSRLSKRESTPGKDSIVQGLVKNRAEMFEKDERSKMGSTNFIPDLKKAGTRIGAMKGKGTSANTSNKGKNATSHNRSNRRDLVATAPTPYSKTISLPLEVCVWGSWVFKLNDDARPDFWLRWNDDAEELQIYKGPLGEQKKKCAKIKKFSWLRGCDITISDDHDFHLIVFSPNGRSRGDVFDLNEDIVLSFKIINRHANTNSDWADLFSRLKRFADESGTKLEHVIGPSTRRCLEGALKAAEISEPKSRRKGKKAVEPPPNDSDDSNSSKETSTRTMAKKPQPKPRAVKKMNQDQNPDQKLPDMFNDSSARRSSRLLAEVARHDSPPANLDEIILVYPPSGLGAVNISKSDLRRLEPSEFLNDTLIELGLKFWLKDLREKQPELADDVHVFSSFFFKKLASKNNKTAEDGHKSVRKWTAKVDIFKKKYIIVPINENLHWYLAIIYYPEHILEPSAPKPPPRSSKRVSRIVANNGSSPIRGAATRNTKLERLNSFGPNPLSPMSTRTNDSDAEVEIEKELTEDAESGVVNILRSCSLEESLSTSHSRAMSPEGNLTYPVEESGDEIVVGPVQTRQRDTINGIRDNKEEDSDINLPEQLGHIDGGGPPPKSFDLKDPAVVNDSLSEESHDSEAEDEIDQLDQDDNEPLTSYLANSGSGTPLPSRFEVLRPFACDPEDAGFPMDIDSEINEVQFPARETSVSNSIDAMDEDVQPVHGTENGISVITRQNEHLKQDDPIPPQSFYTKEAVQTYDERKRPQKDLDPKPKRQTTEDDELDMLAKQRDADRQSSEELEVSQQQRTIIFCMDSLGSTHPKAMSRLNDYLQEEAKDKKGIESPSSALVKKALVPAQPNFCDCGLYLLHFAQTFMTDPEKYKAAIFATKKTTASDRNVLWLNEQVATMREGMKARILEESKKWKKVKADKEQNEQGDKVTAVDGVVGQQPVSVEDSDDEIVVSEVRHIGVPSPKKRAKAPRTAAARIR